MFQRPCSYKLVESLSGLTDQEWLEVMIESVDRPIIKGIEMPGFPSEEMQRTIVGMSGAHSLREAFNFYCTIKQYAVALGVTLSPATRILDFGCGWGRVMRFFLKDIREDNLYGVDVNPEMIDVCLKSMKYGTYGVVNPVPPLEFQPGSIDIIYAYSVFSHLAEPVHIKWIEEFSKILKPGGILVVTTQARHFIEFCRSLRGKTHEFAWHNALAGSFPDTEAALLDYDSGKFLYCATGGGPALPNSFYGEALIPCSYVKREWTRFLIFMDYFDDRNRFQQAVIVMQKPMLGSNNIAPVRNTATDVEHKENWFDHLVWQEDRMLLNGLTFRLEHYKNDNWELGDECFMFYKTKRLVDEYERFYSGKQISHYKNILELGMWDGGSIVFWNEFFKPKKIVGVDIQQIEDSKYLMRYKQNRDYESSVKTYWGVDQTDSKRLREIIKLEFDAPVDLVIDDASHQYEATKHSFETIFPFIRHGGFYIIEDWAWGHWDFDFSMSLSTAPTRLIFELVEAAGSSNSIISNIAIFQGVTVIERGCGEINEPDKFSIEKNVSHSLRDAYTGNTGRYSQNMEKIIKDREVTIKEKDAIINNLQFTLSNKDMHIGSLELLLNEKENTLNNIYKSRGWKALLFYYKLRDKVLK